MAELKQLKPQVKTVFTKKILLVIIQQEKVGIKEALDVAQEEAMAW